MTYIIKAAFPSSPELRHFIKNLKWSILLTDFCKTFWYNFQIIVNINTKHESGKASLVYQILIIISSTAFAISAAHNRHFLTSTNFFLYTF